MTRLMVAAVAVLAAAGSAFSAGTVLAADLPGSAAPPPAPAYIPAPPPFSWTGFYMGGNLGYGFASASSTVTGGGVTATGSESLSGFIGGVQAGANYQYGMAVFGIEADFDGSTQSKTTTFGIVTETDKIPWLGTVRGRLGLAFDRFLVYGTGGAGWGNFQSTITATGFGTATGTQSHNAWVAGAGLEYAITNNFTAGIEYLYLDTGNISLGNFAGVTATGRVQDSLVRFRANYKLP
jgi:outer membrane immunogenic protein